MRTSRRRNPATAPVPSLLHERIHHHRRLKSPAPSASQLSPTEMCLHDAGAPRRPTRVRIGYLIGSGTLYFGVVPLRLGMTKRQHIRHSHQLGQRLGTPLPHDVAAMNLDGDLG